MEEGTFDKVQRNSKARVLWAGVVLVLLVIVVYFLVLKKENLVDFNGPKTNDYGIKQRFGQEFSGANQGERSVVYNDTLKNLVPGILPRGENLVGGREPPVFNEIGNVLQTYYNDETPALAAEIRTGNASDMAVAKQSAAEKFTNPRQVTDEAELRLLAQSTGLAY